MKSPDGSIEAICSDYGEFRMGSPEFGRIELVGSLFKTEGRLFGDAMTFSADSRYFVISELISSSIPACRVVAFDMLRGGEHIIFSRSPSLITSVEWTSPKELKIMSWSLIGGEEESRWHPKTDGLSPIKKSRWKFWK